MNIEIKITNESPELIDKIKQVISNELMDLLWETTNDFFENIGLDYDGDNCIGKLNLKELGLDDNKEIYIGLKLDDSYSIKDIKEIKKESYEEYIKAEKEDFEKDLKIIRESFKKDKLDQLKKKR